MNSRRRLGKLACFCVSYCLSEEKTNCNFHTIGVGVARIQPAPAMSMAIDDRGFERRELEACCFLRRREVKCPTPHFHPTICGWSCNAKPLRFRGATSNPAQCRAPDPLAPTSTKHETSNSTQLHAPSATTPVPSPWFAHPRHHQPTADGRRPSIGESEGAPRGDPKRARDEVQIVQFTAPPPLAFGFWLRA